MHSGSSIPSFHAFGLHFPLRYWDSRLRYLDPDCSIGTHELVLTPLLQHAVCCLRCFLNGCGLMCGCGCGVVFPYPHPQLLNNNDNTVDVDSSGYHYCAFYVCYFFQIFNPDLVRPIPNLIPAKPQEKKNLLLCLSLQPKGVSGDTTCPFQSNTRDCIRYRLSLS